MPIVRRWGGQQRGERVRAGAADDGEPRARERSSGEGRVVRAVARAGRTPADRYAVSLAIISSPSGLRGARASSAL